MERAVPLTGRGAWLASRLNGSVQSRSDEKEGWGEKRMRQTRLEPFVEAGKTDPSGLDSP